MFKSLKQESETVIARKRYLFQSLGISRPFINYDRWASTLVAAKGQQKKKKEGKRELGNRTEETTGNRPRDKDQKRNHKTERHRKKEWEMKKETKNRLDSPGRIINDREKRRRESLSSLPSCSNLHHLDRYSEVAAISWKVPREYKGDATEPDFQVTFPPPWIPCLFIGRRVPWRLLLEGKPRPRKVHLGAWAQVQGDRLLRCRPLCLGIGPNPASNLRISREIATFRIIMRFRLLGNC